MPYEVIAHQEKLSIQDIQRLVKAAMAAGVMMPVRRRYEGAAVRLAWT